MTGRGTAKGAARWVAAACGVLLSGAALALPLVDTGTPSGGSWTLNYSQWLASEFRVAEATRVTSLAGYFGTWEGPGGTVTIALRADGGAVPGAELFSGSARFVPTPAVGWDYGWAGVSGVDTLLQPGDYWIAFESRPGDADLVMGGGAPNALRVNAHNQSHSPDWATLTGWAPTSSDMGLGVRIEGERVTGASTVPEPTSVLLFGTGLAGLAAAARRRREKSAD